jgi:hypothetical protein
MAKAEWIEEGEAVKLLKKHPRTIRRKVKSGAWDISYRTLEGKCYEYDRNGIERLKNRELKMIA